MTVTDSSVPPKVHLHIGDRKLDTGSGGTFARVNPGTGKVDAQVPLAGKAEIDDAVRVAHEAFQIWRHTPGAERRRLLLRWADLMDANATQLFRLMGIEGGSSFIRFDAPNAGLMSEWTRYYAGWADKQTSEVVGTGNVDGDFSYTLAQPYGVIGVIVTWNGAAGSVTMKVPAMLAAGNTVVVKPPAITPFGTELLTDLAREAGFPTGVFNVLPGEGEAGEALVTHPLVKKVSFTGGPATAQRILQSCSATIKPVVLELGGKSADIVFDDADIDAACAHVTTMTCGPGAGQGCTYPTRLVVQRSIYTEVIEKVKAIAEGFITTDPRMTGPVINQAAVDRILEICQRAPAEGARLVTGGERMGGDLAEGFYIAPTVFADVNPYSELAQGEVFGPVLSIIPFDTEAEAIEIANSTDYGLAAYLWTNDVARVHRMTEELVAGEIMVNKARNLVVNRPFGGLGMSGVGKEGGRQGLAEFLRVKSIGIGIHTEGRTTGFG